MLTLWEQNNFGNMAVVVVLFNALYCVLYHQTVREFSIKITRILNN